MAGIIAHTVGVIAAAAGKPDRFVTVGTDGGNFFGYSDDRNAGFSPNNPFGSINDNTFSGETVHAVAANDFVSPTSPTFVVILSGTLSSSFFTSITVQTIDHGDVVLNTSSATHETGTTGDSDPITRWTWDTTSTDSADGLWDTPDLSSVREIILTL